MAYRHVKGLRLSLTGFLAQKFESSLAAFRQTLNDFAGSIRGSVRNHDHVQAVRREVLRQLVDYRALDLAFLIECRDHHRYVRRDVAFADTAVENRSQ